MNFFNTIKDSLYNPDFYKGRVNSPIKEAWAYFFKVSLVFSLLFCIIFSSQIIPRINTLLSDDSLNALVDLYPQELKITIKDGKLSTNVVEPYAIPATAVQYPDSSTEKPTKKNIIVIDTNADANPQSFFAHDTYVLVTRDYILGERQRGQLSIQSLQGLPNSVLDRSALMASKNYIKPLFIYVGPILALVILVGGFILNVISSMFTLLILSLLVWLFASMKHLSLNYAQSYKLGLYAISWIMLVDLVAALFGLRVSWILGALIFLIAIVGNFRNIPAKKS